MFIRDRSKGHGGDLAVHANTKCFILLQYLVQRHKGFLALVVEAGGSFGDLYLLARIHQLHLGGILTGVRHAVGELDLLHLETPQVERLALGCSILPGGDGIHHFARRVAQGAIQRIDVLQGRDLKYGCLLYTSCMIAVEGIHGQTVIGAAFPAPEKMVNFIPGNEETPLWVVSFGGGKVQRLPL